MPEELLESIRMVRFLLAKNDLSRASQLLEPWVKYRGIQPALDQLFDDLGLPPDSRQPSAATQVFSGPVVAVDGLRALVRLEDSRGHRELLWFRLRDLGGSAQVGDLVVVSFRRLGGQVIVEPKVIPPPTLEETRQEEERLADLFGCDQD